MKLYVIFLLLDDGIIFILSFFIYFGTMVFYMPRYCRWPHFISAKFTFWLFFACTCNIWSRKLSLRTYFFFAYIAFKSIIHFWRKSKREWQSPSWSSWTRSNVDHQTKLWQWVSLIQFERYNRHHIIFWWWQQCQTHIVWVVSHLWLWHCE